MRARASASIALLALCAGQACGPEPDPYCTDYDDVTGRAVALCRDLAQQPVCDAPADTARFERDSGGMVRLVGGSAAICDDDRQIVCPDEMGAPYCLPELAD
ncbi:MAG: hypothetical protein M3Y87_24970 [Myxococcota bacterium]|nr:hypothetical protein [Myxococcota bacterium]